MNFEHSFEIVVIYVVGKQLTLRGSLMYLFMLHIDKQRHRFHGLFSSLSG